MKRRLAVRGLAILGGAGVQGNKPRARAIGAVVLTALVCASSAAQTTTTLPTGSILSPAVWQGPEINAQSNSTGGNLVASPATPAVADSTHSVLNPLRVALQTSPPTSPQYNVQPSDGARRPLVPPQDVPAPRHVPAGARAPGEPKVDTSNQPLLDGNSPTEELMPPVVVGESDPGEGALHIKPYGGGHPTDWSWGCGGSPYRQGPGMCDNYKVGPRWHFTFDGLVMQRDNTDTTALMTQMAAPTDFVQGGIGPNPQVENFGYGPGGRITFTSEVPRYVGYQVQAAYEGINDWDASIVFPKIPIVTDPGDPTATPPVPPTIIPNSGEQRSLHYNSNYNSGEISWVTSCDENWHPFFGFRYIKLSERLEDRIDQVVPLPPLPGESFTTLDQRNLFDIDNNLMGFQIGMLHEAWCINRRFTIEGFVDAGVYYNHIKYFNQMGSYTTVNTTPVNSGTFTEISDAVNNDASDLSEISYTAEASLSGVCRLNKCWALRGGYQVLWMDNVHLADAAYLGNNNSGQTILFQGWHAGIECRR
ncbi:MAG TPA: BBP7 family outer membrane beta-barrel protein [Lacipirellulaceae bacterium]|nr:BBP7 family outer membrane beta-barrel protein [Lacipirellulaceae bacterium]